MDDNGVKKCGVKPKQQNMFTGGNVNGQLIKEWKKKNDNSSFTQKDMLIYVISKIDKLDDKLSEGEGKIASNRQAISDHVKSCDEKHLFTRKLLYILGGAFGTGFLFIVGMLK